jgi:predicted branched-subunit amino acid permease
MQDTDRKQKKIKDYFRGMKDGIPIALGYFFVSTGFGISAVNEGLSVLESILISLTNLTSAGQVAGLRILSENTAFAISAAEMLLTQFIINLRYSLMGISLSQKTDDSFTPGKRALCAFSITDEIFALASSSTEPFSVYYFLVLSFLPILGWSGGTFLGATAGSVLPAEISSIFGIAIYGMFLAIFVSPSKRDKSICFCVTVSAALSCAIWYIPIFRFISPGFSIIISSVIAAVLTALFFPHEEVIL